MALEKNTLAPDFSLPDQDGRLHTLSEHYKGQALVLFFYPKDFSRICTKENCAFRDSLESFTEKGYKVLGISSDSVEKHKRFHESMELNFPLLADQTGKTLKKYRVKLPFLQLSSRVTYVLNEEHRIISVYERFFKGEEHVRHALTIVNV